MVVVHTKHANETLIKYVVHFAYNVLSAYQQF